MAAHLVITKTLHAIKIEHMERDLNSHMDVLAGLASTFEGENVQIITVDFVSVSTYKTHQESFLSNTELGPRWIDPSMEILLHEKLPNDKREVHKLQVKATCFWISPMGHL